MSSHVLEPACMLIEYLYMSSAEQRTFFKHFMMLNEAFKHENGVRTLRIQPQCISPSQNRREFSGKYCTGGYTPVRTYALPDKRVNWHNWELRWPIEVILGANCTKTASWTYLSRSEVSSDTTTGTNITRGGHEGFSAYVTPLVFLSGHDSA